MRSVSNMLVLAGRPQTHAQHPLPRYREQAGPALFDQGFRPFFLLAAIWGPVALVLWLSMLAGALELPTAFDPVAWHVHEMLFGFVAAAIGGFLLTAIPNWTGRLPTNRSYVFP